MRKMYLQVMVEEDGFAEPVHAENAVVELLEHPFVKLVSVLWAGPTDDDPKEEWLRRMTDG
jgi:hypothetical protein